MELSPSFLFWNLVIMIDFLGSMQGASRSIGSTESFWRISTVTMRLLFRQGKNHSKPSLQFMRLISPCFFPLSLRVNIGLPGEPKEHAYPGMEQIWDHRWCVQTLSMRCIFQQACAMAGIYMYIYIYMIYGLRDFKFHAWNTQPHGSWGSLLPA